jgi:signal transduction histidine kinase
MRRMRGTFARRLGCALFLLLFFIAMGLSSLTWLIVNARDLFAQHQHTGFPLFLPLGGIGILLLALLGLGLAARSLHRAAQPVNDLLEGVSRVADGDYSQRVAEQGSAEMRDLVHAFNEMASRLEVNEQQRKDLLADVTHELRTPITVIQGNLEGMLDGIYPADPTHLEALLEETRVLSRVIEDLRTLSLAEGGALKLQLELTDVSELLEETAEAFRARAEAGGVQICVEAPASGLLAEADPTRVREVMGNLISNALRYTPPGGEIRLSAQQGVEGKIHVAVHDSGRGIPAEEMPHIFERFYKGSDSHGTGLGLAIAKSLITAHHGEIQAVSQAGAGTTIEFSLPLAP